MAIGYHMADCDLKYKQTQQDGKSEQANTRVGSYSSYWD